MTVAKKATSRKKGARMRRLGEIRKRMRAEVQSQTTKEQVAILLKTWSRQGIVREPAEPR